ncbi:MlaC/ttg2D family ABC transporter substrate-binding protein [Rhodoferax sp.]|uniref:MlaC/ttg2D family ABC transporter substrate-binding protein n=1 Tax=Rhodoferax sp. TaxID=50421 RepID=UPI002731E570|nr:ABC transporter substrate-binding protein [Rhodoferax sp.]MDP1530745.1 ABC transporter substrate-binding protein [Rhodoferax sp.]MDP1942431.1 ABC transporter substrate-binding protein [Rhodoferax sp.]MDP2441935.1 ABC transporter substrate-binding protein [Rhodoferax sp.]MDP3338593.1 ABC transporter substrate-binding protein [Rhodoferax sp.]MDZ4208049.1 ABC transporter substrate-binding protein [Rhodoferax sp.]
MKKRLFNQWLLALTASLSLLVALPVQAADEAPDALINRLTKEALDTIQADKAVQAGDVSRIIALVDEQVMPHLNFQRMTASAVGPAWRQASPEQRKRLEAEFKTLLVRTYAGAMSQAKNLSFNVKPLRAAADDKEVIVRTLITGRGDPVQLDYRLEKTPGVGAGWKIYNLNVLGVWLVDTYRSQFAQEINAKGLDGLIATLSERNKSNAAANAKPAKG